MERVPYPPAHAVAETVAQHFRRHLQLAGIPGEVPAPDAATIERIINAAFCASLRREEGREPTISLAYLPPEAAGTALLVERPMPLDPTNLTKLAPAVERPGIHLGVWKNGGDLAVWGATRTIPPLCFVVEVIEPGLLVIKHRRADPEGKFANVSLLVVPHGTASWRKSIVSVPYTVAPPFSKLGDLVRNGTRDGAFKDATDAIGGLTAVDGAVVLSDRWDVLAFGAKIGRTESGPFVGDVLVREPILGHTPVTVHASELGGTRHLSAAQFVHEQRDSLALVASQDGRFTVFGWSQRAKKVHAYRVEALLL